MVRSARPEPPARPLLDRLGVRPGMRVAIVRLADPAFANQLRERGARVLDSPETGCELIFVLVEDRFGLSVIADLRPLIPDRGAIWVLRPKGAGALVRETDVIEAGRACELVDNKVASFSDTLAGMRLVVPLAARRPRGIPG